MKDLRSITVRRPARRSGGMRGLRPVIPIRIERESDRQGN